MNATGSLLLSLLLLPSTAAPPAGGDPADELPAWSGFRGNNGTGVADAAIPSVLDPERNLLWRAEVPTGYSSPVVWGGRVFLTGAIDESLVTMCLDRASGDVLWDRTIEFSGKRPGMNSPAAPTPVTDGERVYVTFHHAGIVAYSVEGDELWHHPLGPINIPHGMATSPLLWEDLLIQLVDQDITAFLVALDKRTGEERWRVERPGVTHSYATPAIYEPAEGPAQVVVPGTFRMNAYDARTGEELWWVDGSAWQTKNVPVIAGDVCYINAYMIPASEAGAPKITQSWEEALAEKDANGDGRITRDEWQEPAVQMLWFILDLDGDDALDERDWEFVLSMGTQTGGLFAIRMDGEGDVTDSKVVWKYDDRRGLPDCSSPLLLDGVLYMIKEGGLLTAMDAATGEVLERGRVGDPDGYYASPVAAGDRILCASHSGQLSVVHAGADWEVLATRSLGETVWATPALADGQVLVRSDQALYCFAGEPAEEPEPAPAAAEGPEAAEDGNG